MNKMELKILKKYKNNNKNILQAVTKNIDYLILYTSQGVLDINLKGKKTIHTNDKKWNCSNDKEDLKRLKDYEMKLKILNNLEEEDDEK